MAGRSGGDRRGGGRRTQRPTDTVALIPQVVATPTGTVELVALPGHAAMWQMNVNGVPSSAIDLDDPGHLDFEYMQWIADLLITHQRDQRWDMVHLGGAGCAVARFAAAQWPASRHLVVEIDPVVAEKAREWFSLPRSPVLRINVGEAGERLRAMRSGSADVVIRDVFAGDHTPPHLTGDGFTREVSRVLTAGGIYAANVAARPPGDGLKAEIRDVAAVFAHLAVVSETSFWRGRRYGNALVVASAAPLKVDVWRVAVARRPVPTRVLDRTEALRYAG